MAEDDSIEVWVDATSVSIMYEQQVCRSGRWRHRRLRLGSVEDELLGRPIGVGEWKPGPAPDMDR